MLEVPVVDGRYAVCVLDGGKSSPAYQTNHCTQPKRFVLKGSFVSEEVSCAGYAGACNAFVDIDGSSLVP